MTKVNVGDIAILATRYYVFERLASQSPRVITWVTLIGCTQKYSSYQSETHVNYSRYQNGSQRVRIPDYGTQLTIPAGTNALPTDP